MDDAADPKTPVLPVPPVPPIPEPDAHVATPKQAVPATTEQGGPKGPEPTRYGDWERAGRAYDF